MSGRPSSRHLYDGRGAQERSRDITARGARFSARPWTAPSTVAVLPPLLGRSSIEVGIFQAAHLGKFEAALTAASCVSPALSALAASSRCSSSSMRCQSPSTWCAGSAVDE
jgi:hypothetical protein